MITVSENAVKHLQSLLLKKGSETGAGLRLFVETGGCAGMQYAMQVTHPEAGDIHIDAADGVKIFLAQDSVDFLRDSRVDYSDSLSDAGFKIINPNASRSCGCGTSFEPASAAAQPSYSPEQDGSVCGSETPA